MRSPHIAVLLALAGCLDLSSGRYYACDPHAATTQCAANWFCAGDGVCRPNDVGVESPCESDEQCATGWRCNVREVCKPDPRVTLPRSSFSSTTLSSELGVERVVASPLLVDGPTTYARFFVATRDGGLLFDTSISPQPNALVFRHQVSRESTPPASHQLAVASLLYSASDAGLCMWLDGGCAPVSPTVGLLRSTLSLQRGPGGEPVLAPLPLWLDNGTLRAGSSARLSVSWPMPQPAVDLSGVDTAPVCGPGVSLNAVATTRDSVLFAWSSLPMLSIEAQALLLLTPGVATAVLRPGRVRVGNGWLAIEGVTQAERPYVSMMTLPRCPGADGGLLARDLDAGLAMAACRVGETLVDFAPLPDGRVERLCEAADGGAQSLQVFSLASDLPTPLPRRMAVDSSAPGLRSWWTPSEVSFGTAFSLRAPLVLDRSALRVIATPDGIVATTSEGMQFVHRPDLGLILDRTTEQGQVISRFVEGAPGLAVLQNGVVIAALGDGGLAFVAAPEGELSAKRVASAFADPERGVIVETLGDAVLSNDPSAGTPALEARARPAAGFEITAGSFRSVADGGLLEGYVVTNRRLYQVTASAATRFDTAELGAGSVDVISVWQQSGSFVAALSSGQVVALPSLVPLTPRANAAVTAVAPLCGMPVILSGDFVGVPADGGWQSASVGRVPGADALHADGRRVFVSTRRGSIVMLEAPACP